MEIYASELMLQLMNALEKNTPQKLIESIN